MATIDEIVTVLKKEPTIRSEDENQLLIEWSFLVPEAEARIKGELTKSILKQRSIEQEESIESIERKADILADLIRESNYIVIYTGAGISTSASIPDYRGPNGLWTQIRKTGKFSITKIHDLSSAEPTVTHMAIKELCRRKIVNHVVSQNCDGLHLRSGIPQQQLSEIHGNMFIEVCPTCEKQYFRQADITERTCRFRHKTGRKCHTCKEPNNNLIDTIVLYGERSRTKWPMNWERAGKAAKKADLIICMGSSLKTLRRYNSLWPKKSTNNNNNNSNNSTQLETKLVIINLQYTSKDKNAVLKINGKCDLVMQLVMHRLNINIPSYNWMNDPLMKLAVPFTAEERQGLKRNLIFEIKQRQQRQLKDEPSQICDGSSSNKDNNNQLASSELSKSPSLFVSELTDDPDKKSLRMRIRAVNSTPTSDNSSSNTTNHQNNSSSPMAVDIEDELLIKNQDLTRGYESNQCGIIDGDGQIMIKTNGFALPGWLGKSLGSSKTSSYRRKRHGNKGRKHSTVLKQQKQQQQQQQRASEELEKEARPVEEISTSLAMETNDTITINNKKENTTINNSPTTTTTTTATTIATTNSSSSSSVKIEHKPLDLVNDHNHQNHNHQHHHQVSIIETSII